MIWEKRQHSGRRETITPVESEVVVYGTSWCGMTQMVRRYLDKLDIPYKYLDLDEDQDASKQLRWITGGYMHHPTVVINGQALIEPELDELEIMLTRNGFM
jgi:mycoredoxin